MGDGGPIYDGVQNVLGGLNTSVQQSQNAITTAQVTNPRNPAWVCRYPVADVSFPEILNVNMTVFGNTLGASAGTAHTHALDNGTSIATGPGWPVAQNQAMGVYITSQNTVVMDTVGIIIWKTVAGTLNNVFLEIYRQNASGGMDLVTSQDISSSITTTVAELEFAIGGSGLLVSAGGKYMVRVRNASTVATTFDLKGMPTNTGVSPALGTWWSSGATGATSYTAAAMATAISASGAVAWAMLAATGTVAADKAFNDDFDRSALGGDVWLTMSNTGTNQLGITQIANGGFFSFGLLGSNGVAGFQGTTNGDQAGLYIHAVSSDAMRVDGQAIGTNATPGGLLICSNADMTNLAFLQITDSAATIYSGAWNSLTSQATVSTSSNDATWSIYYEPTPNRFTVLKNGVSVLTWTDSGNVVSHGLGHRMGGIRISRVSGVNGLSVDNFNVRDWKP